LLVHLMILATTSIGGVIAMLALRRRREASEALAASEAAAAEAVAGATPGSSPATQPPEPTPDV
jgi:alpha/beta superfamily hydrolase